MNLDHVRSLGTILSVWAHPDDEAFLAGGIMAAAAGAGSRVVCVTATRGEGGANDAAHGPPEVMAKIREVELATCLEILGVSEHVWLDYVDGECAHVPPDEPVATLRSILDEVRPDTILTFGPEGFTDHPDHKAVSTWVVEAHRRTPHADRRRVHFATQSHSWAADHLDVLTEIDVFPPGFPPLLPETSMSIDAVLTGELRARKLRALRAQKSQIDKLVDAIGVERFERAFSTERFRAG